MRRKPEFWGDYRTHRTNAKNRGVEFLLTFEEWLKIWEDSGRLFERGNKRGQYCMARFGDTGPYVVGNVRIATNRENSDERVYSLETRAKWRAARLRQGKIRRGVSRKVSRLCKCGCGVFTKPGKEFVRGHANRGKRNGRAILTEASARALICDYAAARNAAVRGGRIYVKRGTVAGLLRKYGILESCFWHIIAGDNWKYLKSVASRSLPRAKYAVAS